MKAGNIIIAIHFEPIAFRAQQVLYKYRILNKEKSFLPIILPSYNALFIVFRVVIPKFFFQNENILENCSGGSKRMF